MPKYASPVVSHRADYGELDAHRHRCRCLSGEGRGLPCRRAASASRHRGRRGFIRVPQDPLIDRIAAGAGMDAADNWIAERAGPGDIVITADIPLASRCVKAGADVIAPNGRAFTEESIGMTLAVRNLMHDLRSAGETTRGPPPFSPRDRSTFLSALDAAIRRAQRATAQR